MKLEQFLSRRLRRLSIIDFGFVETAYLIFGILFIKLYPPLALLSGWFYLAVSLICALPVWVRVFGYAGNLWEKEVQFLKHNTPAHQVLIFIACVSFGILTGVIFPRLLSYPGWVYWTLMGLAAAKPLKKVWF